MDAKSAVCRLRLFLQCLDYICCKCNLHNSSGIRESEATRYCCTSAGWSDRETCFPGYYPQNSISQEHPQTPLPQRKVKETSIIHISLRVLPVIFPDRWFPFLGSQLFFWPDNTKLIQPWDFITELKVILEIHEILHELHFVFMI